MTFDDVLESIVKTEGGYTNNPADLGGETVWGITVATARLNGYVGHMKAMPRATAKEIYKSEYIDKPKFNEVFLINQRIGVEVVDTAVNMGIATATMMMQRALNVFNDSGRLYPDITVDGALGPKSMTCLKLYLSNRGKLGEIVFVRCLNALQGEHYVDITEKRQKNEEFIFGWFANRVVI